MRIEPDCVFVQCNLNTGALLGLVNYNLAFVDFLFVGHNNSIIIPNFCAEGKLCQNIQTVIA